MAAASSWKCLNNRKRDTVDFLIDIEGIDIGHAADVVDDSHEAGFEVGAVDGILAGDSLNELS